MFEVLAQYDPGAEVQLDRFGWPEIQGPTMPRFGSWLQIGFDRAIKTKFFAEMHQAATDARRSPDRDYGWVEYEWGRGWILRRKGPLPQDRRPSLCEGK